MRPIKLTFNLPLIGAITIYPWIVASKSTWSDPAWPRVLKHEQKHLEQQGAWYARAWLFGLLAWFVLYELCLPIAWTPFRRRWEREAYAAGQGLSPEQTDVILRLAPYWLWR